MQQEKQQAKVRGKAGRAVTIVAVAVGVLATAGSAIAAGTARPTGSAGPGDAPVAADQGKKPGFFQTYRGHHIMGWGEGDSACAYIDGNRLVLYPAAGGKYTSSLQGYQPETGLKAITKASVKVLGDLDMAPTTELKANCPQFVIDQKAAPKAASKPGPAAGK